MYYLLRKVSNALIMSQQPTKLSIIKIELLSKTLLHCVTQNENIH